MIPIKIRFPKPSDIKAYTNLFQKTYEAAYVDDSLGLTKECFSKEVFNTPDTQKYLESKLVLNDKQKTWLAFDGKKLVGSITITNHGLESELSAFYVDPDYQNQKIGSRLYKLALEESAGNDIVLDLFSHNKRGIEIYKKWGFEVDKEKGEFTRHWAEWPDGLEAKCLYMRHKGTR